MLATAPGTKSRGASLSSRTPRSPSRTSPRSNVKAEVAGALDEVATIYRRRLDRAIDRVTTLIVPLAEIVLGAIVFMLAYAYIVPLFEWQRNLFGF